MSQKFFPNESIFINASHPHPLNTQYKISIGQEKWDEIFVPVIKVQMVYNGVVAGRLSPSYPNGTTDYLKVHNAVVTLAKNHNIKL